MSLTLIKNYDYPALIALFGMCKTIQYAYPKVDHYLERFEKYKILNVDYSIIGLISNIWKKKIY